MIYNKINKTKFNNTPNINDNQKIIDIKSKDWTNKTIDLDVENKLTYLNDNFLFNGISEKEIKIEKYPELEKREINCARFDANWIDLGKSLYLPNGHPFTLEAWVNFDVFTSIDCILSRNNAVRGGSPYAWMIGLNAGNIRAYDGGTWRNVSYNFKRGNWYHIAFAFDGTLTNSGWYYVNGEFIGRNYFNFSDSTSYNTQIGGYSSSSNDSTGYKSDIRFWDHCRTQKEIQENMYKRLSGNEKGLMGYWKLDEGEGNKVFDSSKNNIVGEMKGPTWEKVKRDFAKKEKSKIKFENKKYLDFDGSSSDYVLLDSQITLTGDYSFSHWIIDPAHSVANSWNMYAGHPGNDDRIALYGGDEYKIRYHNSGNESVWKIPEYEGITAYYTVVKTGDQLELFINGESQGVKTIGVDYPLTLSSFGRAWSTTYWYRGGLSDMEFWNKPLTQSEIKNNMRNGITGKEEGLQHYFPLSSGGNKIKDVVTGLEGTKYGAKWKDWYAKNDIQRIDNLSYTDSTANDETPLLDEVSISVKPELSNFTKKPTILSYGLPEGNDGGHGLCYDPVNNYIIRVDQKSHLPIKRFDADTFQAINTANPSWVTDYITGMVYDKELNVFWAIDSDFSPKRIVKCDPNDFSLIANYDIPMAPSGDGPVGLSIDEEGRLYSNYRGKYIGRFNKEDGSNPEFLDLERVTGEVLGGQGIEYSNGVVIAGSSDGYGTTKSGHIFGIDWENRKELWRENVLKNNDVSGVAVRESDNMIFVSSRNHGYINKYLDPRKEKKILYSEEIDLSEIKNIKNNTISWEENLDNFLPTEKNVALNKKVYGSLPSSNIDLLTDGNTSTTPYCSISSGEQYVIVDLEDTYYLNKIKVWHYYKDSRRYHDTKTQVSEDGISWTTVFNSNISGEYSEGSGGKTHNFEPIKARYIKDFLNGSTSDSGNHWVEIEAYDAKKYTEAKVETSVDGGLSWNKCISGKNIPNLTGNIDSLKLRVTISSYDNSFSPELKDFKIEIEEPNYYYFSKDFGELQQKSISYLEDNIEKLKTGNLKDIETGVKESSLVEKANDYALSFNGVDDYVDGGILNNEIEKIEIAVLNNGKQGTMRNLISYSSVREETIFINSGWSSNYHNAMLGIQKVGGGSITYTENIIPIDEWTVVRIEWDSVDGHYKIYYDNTEQPTNFYGRHCPKLTFTDLEIGRTSSDEFYFKGNISFLKLEDNSGLVLNYKMNSGTGSTLTDYANSNHGIINGATWEPKECMDGHNSLTGLSISSPSDYIEIPVSVIENDSELTIEFVTSVNASTNNEFLGARVNGNRVLNIHLLYANGNTYWDCGNSNSSSYDRISTSNPSGYLNQKHCWSFTKNANTGTMSYYVDGHLRVSGTGKTRKITTPESIKINYDGEFRGDIYEIRIWNKERSQKEVQNNFYKELNGDEDGLVAYYKLNEGFGDIAKDHSLNNNDAQIFGSEWIHEERSETNETIKDVEVVDDSLVLKKKGYLRFKNKTGKINGVNYIPVIENEKTMSFWIRSNRPLSDNDSFYIGYMGNYSASNGELFGLLYGVGECQDLGFWGLGGEYDHSFVHPENKWSSNGRWHHIAITMDPTNKCYAYIDGKKVNGYFRHDNNNIYDHIQANPTTLDVDFVIGTKDNRTWGSGFDYVDIAMLKVWDYDLSQSEINNDMYRDLNGDEAGLVAYLPLDDGFGNIITNKAGDTELIKEGDAFWREGYDSFTNKECGKGVRLTNNIDISSLQNFKEITPEWESYQPANLYADGRFSYVDFGENKNFVGGGSPWTFMAKIKPFTLGEGECDNITGVKSQGDGNYSIMSHFGIYNKKLTWWSNSEGWQYSKTELEKDKFYHIAVSYDGGSSVEFFVNGKSAGLTNVTAANTDMIIAEFLRRGHGQDRYFNGIIKDVSIWDKKLNLEEMRNIINNGTKANTELTESNLLNYYPLRENKGSIIKDEKGNIDGVAKLCKWLDTEIEIDAIFDDDFENKVRCENGKKITVPDGVQNVRFEQTLLSISGDLTPSLKSFSLKGEGNDNYSESTSSFSWNEIKGYQLKDNFENSNLLENIDTYNNKLEIKNKKSIYFDGTSYLEANYPKSIIDGSYSIFGMYKFDNGDAKQMVFKDTSQWGIGIWSETNHIRAHSHAISYVDVYLDNHNLDLNDGNWHIIGQMFDADANKLYIIFDGEKYEGSVTTGTRTISGKIQLAGNPGTSISKFKGDIAGFQMWNKIMTKDEIVNAVNGNVNTEDSNLVIYHDFNSKENTDKVIIDQKQKNEYNAVIYGSAFWSDNFINWENYTGFAQRISSNIDSSFVNKINKGTAIWDDKSCVYFSGTDSHVDTDYIVSDEVYTFNAVATFHEQPGHSEPCLVSQHYPAGGDNIRLSLTYDAGEEKMRAGVYSGSSWNKVFDIEGRDYSKIHSYTVSYDGNTLKLYVDGEIVDIGFDTYSPAADDSYLKLGARWDAHNKANDYWKGNLYSFSYFTRVLSEKEVKDLYNKKEISSEGLIIDYDFNSLRGSVIPNKAGVEYDGVPYNVGRTEVKIECSLDGGNSWTNVLNKESIPGLKENISKIDNILFKQTLATDNRRISPAIENLKLDLQEPIYQEEEGIWYLYTSQNRDNSKEVVLLGDYKIDKTPPEQPDINLESVSDSEVVLRWTNSDSFSGPDYVKIYFKGTDGTVIDIDNDTLREYFITLKSDKNRIVISNLEEYKSYEYKIITYDKAGNYAVNGIYNTRTDDITPPEITCEVNSLDWQNTAASENVSVTDRNGSGVSDVWYQWSKSESAPPENSWIESGSKSNFSVSEDQEGIWYLHLKSADYYNNYSTHVSGPYKIDKTLPNITSTNLEIESVNNEDNSYNAVITWTVSDDLSGVDRTEIKLEIDGVLYDKKPIDNGITMSKEFSVGGDGVQNLLIENIPPTKEVKAFFEVFDLANNSNSVSSNYTRFIEIIDNGKFNGALKLISADLSYDISEFSEWTIKLFRKLESETSFKEFVFTSEGRKFVNGIEDGNYNTDWIDISNGILTVYQKAEIIDEMLLVPRVLTDGEIIAYHNSALKDSKYKIPMNNPKTVSMEVL
jgi:hypothetical protein